MRLTRSLIPVLMLLLALPAVAGWTNEPVVPNISFTAAGDANVTGVAVTDYSYRVDGDVMHVSVAMTGNLSEMAPELYVNIPGAMRANRVHRSGGVNLKVGTVTAAAEWSTAGTQIVVKRLDGQQIAPGPVGISFVIAIDAIPRSSVPPGPDL
ncbi:MAG TPA: hypothetical protein VF761_17020 [Gemmatimonadaceae bacterium]